MTSQWSGSLFGDSHSAAPAMKSATTASIATPLPAIMMPVWPVARKVAGMARSRNAFVTASAVYFFPSAQSVPTLKSRRPERFLPVAAEKTRSV